MKSWATRDRKIRSQQIIRIGIFLIALFWFVYHVCYYRPIDDAYITYLYARNLAEGKGFIYSERYQTWGTTTPLLTILLSLFSRLGIDIPFMAKVLDFIALLLQGAIVYEIFRLLKLARWQPLGVLFLSLLISSATSNPGMEYGLYAACSVGAVLCVITQRWPFAALGAALAATIRPDGALVWIIVAVAWLVQTHGRQKPLLFAGCLILLPLAWYLFAWFKFGRLMPQSLETRQWEAHIWGTFGKDWMTAYLKPLEMRFILLPALAGFILACKRLRPMFWFLIYFAGYILLYSLFGLPSLSQYFCPLNLLVIIFTLVWLFALIELIRKKSRKILYILLFIVSVLSLWKDAVISYGLWSYQIKSPSRWEKLTIYKGISSWLRDSFPPGTSFAANEIGVLGYYSRQDIIEIGSLVNPEGMTYHHNQHFGSLLQKTNPLMIVVPSGFYETLKRGDDLSILDAYFPLAKLIDDHNEAVLIFVKKGIYDNKEIKHLRLMLYQSLASL